MHRAWWVALGGFLVMAGAGSFATVAGLLVEPLHHEFQWSRGAINSAIAVSMVLYGLTSPFAAALMDRIGLRRVVVGALTMLALAAALTTMVTTAWQFTLAWGLLSGLGTGALAATFAATITNRWFVRRHGLVSGLLASANVLGQFLFLPLLGWIIEHHQWRSAMIMLLLAAAIIVPLVYPLLRDHPQDVGLQPYGATAHVPRPAPRIGAARRTVRVLLDGARKWPFWLLAGTFAICGASTNGVMWTHFVGAAHHQGLAVPVAASMLTLIGIFNVVGTVGSGWLTDRFDPRLLLAGYYALRGVSLLVLPGLLGPTLGLSLVTFAIVFGVLDLATVPPTIALCRDIAGQDGAILFGWVGAAHQIGAAVVAFAGGVIRDQTGSYDPIWFLAGGLCFTAALMARFITRDPSTVEG